MEQLYYQIRLILPPPPSKYLHRIEIDKHSGSPQFEILCNIINDQKEEMTFTDFRNWCKGARTGITGWLQDGSDFYTAYSALDDAAYFRKLGSLYSLPLDNITITAIYDVVTDA